MMSTALTPAIIQIIGTETTVMAIAATTIPATWEMESGFIFRDTSI